jgi:sirohydrochlorin cobaltochelatase
MSTPPLLIIGHGSRRPAGVAEFLALVDRVRRRAAGAIPAVEAGMIELAEPSVAASVTRLLDHAPNPTGHPAGQQVVAVPLMLGTAGHVRHDIPALLKAEQDAHLGLSFRYARPLGPHPVLVDLLAARVHTAIDRGHAIPRGPAGPDRVVLVGRGCGHADANAAITAVARQLSDDHGYRDVEVAFVAVADPSVPEVLDRLWRRGARRIVVAPYLLFPGVLSEQIAAETQQFTADHPGVDIAVADVFGDSDEIATLVLERYRQALGVAT